MKILKCLMLLSLLLVSCNQVAFKYKYGDVVHKKDVLEKGILEAIEFYKCEDKLYINGYHYYITGLLETVIKYEFAAECEVTVKHFASELK